MQTRIVIIITIKLFDGSAKVFLFLEVQKQVCRMEFLIKLLYVWLIRLNNLFDKQDCIYVIFFVKNTLKS